VSAGTQRDNKISLLSDLEQALLVTLSGARALDERDLIVLSLLGHRLAPLHDLDSVEQAEMGLKGIDNRQLASLAAREVEEGDSRLPVLVTHYSASSKPLMLA
jgi:hypothetical protein